MNLFDDEQSSPLHVAAFLGKEEIIRILLEHGAALDARGQLDGTPLHAAATANRQGAVALLLEDHTFSERLALVNAHDESLLTPLHRVAQRASGGGGVAALLLAAKAEVDARNVDGYTPLHVAATKGNAELLECPVLAS